MACPAQLPRWYTDLWEPWREAGGLPAEKPKGIPPAAALRHPWLYDCYRARHPHPQPLHDYGLLAGSTWFVREPGSGAETEKIPAAKAAGFTALMLNARDYRGNRWDSWRIIADRCELPVVPVGRIYDGPAGAPDAQQVADETVHYLLDTREAWSSPGVAFNDENEAETVMPPARLANLTSSYHGSMAVLVDYRGWVDEHGYHGTNWAPLAGRAVGIIECFDNTATHAISPVAGVSRALLAGFKRVVPMLAVNAGRGAYGRLSGPRAGYSLDTAAAGEIAGWAA